MRFWIVAGAVYMIAGTVDGILFHSLLTVIVSVAGGTVWMVQARRYQRNGRR